MEKVTILDGNLKFDEFEHEVGSRETVGRAIERAVAIVAEDIEGNTYTVRAANRVLAKFRFVALTEAGDIVEL